MWSCVGLTLLTLATALATYEGEWLWTWQCVAGVCVKTSLDDVPTPGASLEECRLTCDKYGSLWPKPTGATVLGQHTSVIHPSRVTFMMAGGSRRFLSRATDDFLANLAAECGGNCTAADENDVVVKLTTRSEETELDWGTDESYLLEIDKTGRLIIVNITAVTIFGTRHGLETLSQLIASTPDHRLLIANHVRLSDAPAYPHRGLLLDTARHFLPLAAMRRQLDAMAACKMNVLHWHATDSHSFPLILPRVPELARYGAYSPEETYSPAEVAELLDYANARGVRVILEIDAPSHAGNGWQWGPDSDRGNLAVCVNQQPWRKYCIQPPCGQLNPANPHMYTVLRELYKDLVSMFPEGEAFHMGGDEVFLQCWNATEEVVTWMESEGKGRTTEDFMAVWSEFHQKSLRALDDAVGDTTTPVIVWSSHLTAVDNIENYLDKNRYVIETWVPSGDRLSEDLLKKGYRVILATKDTWYLDHGFWGVTRYHNWKVAYDNRIPRRINGVLGGETALWSELIDEHTLDGRVWPRTAAAAERLWSDPSSSSRTAETRFLQMRERLVKRGLKPEAVVPEWCEQNQGECL